MDVGAAQALWQSLREQTHPFFAGPLPLWRLSVPPASVLPSLAGDLMIEWGGAQRWVRTAAPAEKVRGCARELRGHATLFRPGVASRSMHADAAVPAPEQVAVFTPLPPALLELQQRVRAQFDPHGVFDAGRLFGEP